VQPEDAALRERIASLPTEPGVYLFHGEDGRILYVGKAQNLRSRVRSYWNRGGDGRIRTNYLVPRIRDIEVVVTANVKEALLLENQLIKRHRPRFNVRLRDDKNYLALRLDPREEFPRFTETRRFARDGAVQFGPYTSSIAMRETLRSLQRVFPLRTCSDAVFRSYRRKGRPCIEFAVGRCAAPCCDRIDAQAYAALVDGAVRLMRGQAGELVRELREQMASAAAEERFEQAARLRDRIDAIERTTQRQAMVSTQFVDRDVFALARDGEHVEIEALHVRQGKLFGAVAHGFREVVVDDADALDSFLAQFYGGDRDWPQEILLPFAVESAESLEALGRERSGGTVEVHVPQRGERRQLIELAQRNADLALEERRRRDTREDQALEELREMLGLARPPRRIECYDTSHLRGRMHVGSRVVFEQGVPDKDGYRRYRLREADPGDDYAALREILGRRLARLDEDPAPDLLLLDGGKGQLSAVRALLDDLGLGDLSLAALAKERDEGGRTQRHGGTKRERLFLPGVKDPLRPAAGSPALLLLQRIRDESHRFAIRYHRELRQRLATRSVLEEIPGVGPKKRNALLRTLGSLEQIRAASEAELAAVPQISPADAARIAEFFRALAAPDAGGPAAAEDPADGGGDAAGDGEDPADERAPDHA
jgi:excinuclease ABC subunit C